MRFCLRCRRFSGGGPLCTGCGRSFGGRLCRGKTRHLNPHDARFCNFCGTPDMEEAATFAAAGLGQVGATRCPTRLPRTLDAGERL